MNYFKENNLYYYKTAIFLFLGGVTHIVLMAVFGKFSEVSATAALCMFIAAIGSAFPRFFWTLSKIKIIFDANVDFDELEPSWWYILSRKIFCRGTLIIGGALILISLSYLS